MPAQKNTLNKLRRQYNVLQSDINDKKVTHEKLIELLGTACKYCNNLENHLKDKGYSRKNIEEIKESNIPYELNID
jgi:adenine C2-methylase RlmN of 23S rRNA A2503 and tRNA A37